MQYPAIFGPILDAMEAISDEAIEVYNHMEKQTSTEIFSTIKVIVHSKQARIMFVLFADKIYCMQPYSGL